MTELSPAARFGAPAGPGAAGSPSAAGGGGGCSVVEELFRLCDVNGDGLVRARLAFSCSRDPP